MKSIEKEVLKNKGNKVWFYLVLVFFISYGWHFLIFKTGGTESKLFPFVMFIPGIIALALLIISKRGLRGIGWGLGRWRYIFPAIVIPIVVSLGLALLLVFLNMGTLQKIFIFKDGMLESSKIGLILGAGSQNTGFFILNIILSHLVFIVGGSLLTIGEELGWRGYMQETFLRDFGIIKGFIIAGIIWGYWHLPIILMGYNFPENPVLGALVLMPAGTIAIGIFLGWIYLRSKSIWMPVLAHTSINIFSGFLFGMTMHSDGVSGQLFWIGAWGVISVLCILDLKRSSPLLWQDQDIEDYQGNLSCSV